MCYIFNIKLNLECKIFILYQNALFVRFNPSHDTPRILPIGVQAEQSPHGNRGFEIHANTGLIQRFVFLNKFRCENVN